MFVGGSQVAEPPCLLEIGGHRLFHEAVLSGL
jgi:hypothetical protein